jgi:hypothetical protein
VIAKPLGEAFLVGLGLGKGCDGFWLGPTFGGPRLGWATWAYFYYQTFSFKVICFLLIIFKTFL